MNDVENLNACKYLYLDRLEEPADNALRIVVIEAVASSSLSKTQLQEYSTDLQNLLGEAKEITRNSGCKIFEITWLSYIGYSVRDESYAISEKAEGIGRLFVEFTQSRYLDFLSVSTFANTNYPGRFKHWALYCLNHSIDVASTEEPTIKMNIV